MLMGLVTLILSIVGGTSLCYALRGTIKAIEDEGVYLAAIGACYGIALWCLVTAIRLVRG